MTGEDAARLSDRYAGWLAVAGLVMAITSAAWLWRSGGWPLLSRGCSMAAGAFWITRWTEQS